jgi:hypothetical protein
MGQAVLFHAGPEAGDALSIGFLWDFREVPGIHRFHPRYFNNFHIAQLETFCHFKTPPLTNVVLTPAVKRQAGAARR